MINHKKIKQKAVETVTFRLTKNEKILLEYVAELENKTLTDLVKGLVQNRAKELNITELPLPKQKRKPGRPKKYSKKIQPNLKKTSSSSIVSAFNDEIPAMPPSRSMPPLEPRSRMDLEFSVKSTSSTKTKTSDNSIFADNESVHKQTSSLKSQKELHNTNKQTVVYLVSKFRKHFSNRAEGTRREFEDVINFLTEEESGIEPILSPQILLNDLSIKKIQSIRDNIKKSNIRFSKKNLHLTYLRMMFQWAFQQNEITFDLDARTHLQAFTAKEIAGAWLVR